MDIFRVFAWPKAPGETMRSACMLSIALWLSGSVASAAILFSAPRYVSGAGSPILLQTADLNGDHIPDFMIGSQDHHLSYLLSNGTTWGPLVSTDLQAYPTYIHAGDADLDGDLDLVVSVANNVNGTGPPGVFVLWNDGHGAFPNQTFIPAANPHSAFVWTPVAGGPAHILAVAGGTEYHDFTPNGSGGYVDNLVGSSSSSLFGATQSVQGNFTQPGGRGIVAATRNSSGVFGVELVNTVGAGLVTPPPQDLGTIEPAALAAGDIDGDGNEDVLLLYLTDTGLAQVLWGRANGSFIAGPSVDTGQPYAESIALGDLDQDGKLDIAVTGGTQSRVRFLHGNGDGTFTPAGSIPARYGTRSLALADLDRDGMLDLVTASDSVSTGFRFVGWRYNRWNLVGVGDILPHAVRLEASPNPASGPMRITLEVPSGGGRVRVRVVDVAGREVAQLFDGETNPGELRLVWTPGAGAPVVPGIYHVIADGPASRASVRVVRLR